MQASTKRKSIRPQAVLPSAAAATARRTASTSAELPSQASIVRLSFCHTQASMSGIDAIILLVLAHSQRLGISSQQVLQSLLYFMSAFACMHCAKAFVLPLY